MRDKCAGCREIEQSALPESQQSWRSIKGTRKIEGDRMSREREAANFVKLLTTYLNMKSTSINLLSFIRKTIQREGSPPSD